MDKLQYLSQQHLSFQNFESVTFFFVTAQEDTSTTSSTLLSFPLLLFEVEVSVTNLDDFDVDVVELLLGVTECELSE